MSTATEAPRPRAVLVGVQLAGVTDAEQQSSLTELKRLCEGPDPPERLDPIDPGKPNVHEDQARPLLEGEADTLFPRLRLDDPVPLELQHVPDELPVLLVVLDDENQLICHGAPEW